MRYGRVAVDGQVRWVRPDDDRLELLSGSPLESTPHVVGSVGADDVAWLPPIIPTVFYAVGLNYRSHIEHAKSLGNTAAVLPERPEIGYRANNALTGHGSPIIKPAGVSGRFEAEPEIVAVIGRSLRNASRSEAEESIFGWTIGNDVSAREWQHADRTFWRSKNSDTFKPMGPWIETDVDPMKQTTTLRVDGEIRASFETGAMVFDPFDYLVEMSRHLTIHPGDVLWMGADATAQISPGETVDVEITGVGVLSNPVHLEVTPDKEGISNE